MRNPAPPRGSEPGEWRLVEELRLGRIDGTGPEVFGDVHWQPPNRIWIADLYQQLSYDSLGNELTRTGQPFGPGMPVSGSAIRDGLSRGTIVAADGSGFVYQQVSVRDRTTAGDETVSHSRTYGVRMPIYPEHPNPVLPRDSVLLDSRISTSTSQSRASGDGNITIGGIIKVSIPRRVWAFAGGETVWVANRAVHRFHEVTFAGDTLRTIELGNPPQPPPDDSDDSRFEPLIAGLEASPEGWLWVLRNREDADEGPTWDLFDNCGRYRGEVSAPERIAALRFGGETVESIDLGAGGVIHGIARDALDVSYVLRLRLESASGTPVVAEACSELGQ